MAPQRPFRFGVVAAQARSAHEWAAKAQRAEALGYSTLLLPDTLGHSLPPFPALAFLAGITTRLHVGTYVLANDMHNPVMLAREAAALDWLSGGRFELGLGAGRPGSEADHRALGIPFDTAGVRIERLAETIDLLKRLFAGETVTLHGARVSAEGASVFPQVVQRPRPPLLIAAAGAKMLALAGREADGVAFAIPPDGGAERFHEARELLRNAAGSRFEQIELNLNLMAVGSDMPPWLARAGIDVEHLQRINSPAVLLGSPDEMAAQLEARRAELGVSYISVSDAFMDAFAPVVERLAGR